MRGSDGASPMTSRELALQLLARLPDETRKKVGEALLQNTATDASVAVCRLRDEILDKPHPEMVMYPVAAPQEAVVSAVSAIVKGARERQTRRRGDAVEGQLEVWDLREGWTGGGYDGLREHRLSDIARETNATLSTVKDRYRRAFARIVGRPFDTELWIVLFLSLKLESSLRKTWRMRRPGEGAREVPLSRLRPRGEASDPAGDTSDDDLIDRTAGDCDERLSEFHTHMTELLAGGLPAAGVVARLAVDFGFTMTPEERDRLFEYVTNAPNRLE
jgi:hypothetical protein